MPADIRYAVRTLRKNPGFTLVAVLTLALGIGVNTTIFSGISALLLRSLPYAEPDRLVAVWMGERGGSISKSVLTDLRERQRSFTELAGFSGWGFALTGRERPERLDGAKITANLFEVLGAQAALGRTFAPEHGQAGGDAVVLSHGLWQRLFGGDPGVIGQTLTLNGDVVPIVGVMPPAFRFPDERSELWVSTPVDPANEGDYSAGYLRVVGRLRPGVSPEQAQAEMRALAGQLREARPDEYGEEFGRQAAVSPLREDLVGDVRHALLVLLGAVGFVLLLACANVANLLLTRAAAREREMAIRTALGAGWSRIVRQLLTESTLLALAGGGLGLLLAYWGAGFLQVAIPGELLGTSAIRIDARVLAFTLGLSLLVGILFGLAPALRATRTSPGVSLKERGSGASGPGRRRLQKSLIVSEVALALVLVVGAGLMLQSFWRLRTENPGFQAGGVLTLRISPSPASYPEREERHAYWGEILEQVEALPGVVSAGAIHLLPLGGSNWNDAVQVEGRVLNPGESALQVDWRAVTQGYFETMRVPLLRGRLFTEQDRHGAERVALINQTLARSLFPGEDPIGKRIATSFEGEGNWATVVGVVGDTKDQSLAGSARPQMYRPHLQTSLSTLTLMVRTGGDPLALAPSVREAVWSIDRDVPIADMQPLERVVWESVSQSRLVMVLLGIFGILALLLGATGIYGVMAYFVGQRTQEIGVRTALGARAVDILRLVLSDALRLVLIGLALGTAGALLLTGVLESQLYEVAPTDPLTFAAVATLISLVALLASYVPARRASRVDPMTALRAE